jgi:hypothetical protein
MMTSFWKTTDGSTFWFQIQINRPFRGRHASFPCASKKGFVGAIYAPEATLTLNGGGNGNNLEGSSIVASGTLNGHYDFHYDLALASLIFGANRGYIPTSWQEIY